MNYSIRKYNKGLLEKYYHKFIIQTYLDMTIKHVQYTE